MDVELPQDTNDALTPTTTHQGSVASLPTPRAETAGANQQAPQEQASMMTRSRARNAPVFSAVAPPTAQQTGSIQATLETGPRSTLALQLPSDSEGERFADALTGATVLQHTVESTSQESQNANMDTNAPQLEATGPDPSAASPPPALSERTDAGSPLTRPCCRTEPSAPSTRGISETHDQAISVEGVSSVTARSGSTSGALDIPPARGSGGAPTVVTTRATTNPASPVTTTRQTTLSPPPPETSSPSEPRLQTTTSGRNARQATARDHTNATSPLHQPGEVCDAAELAPGFRSATPPAITTVSTEEFRTERTAQDGATGEV